MRDYVETADDHGGVHINSGILNHGFYWAATQLGGLPWLVLGRIWYIALTERLEPHTTFQEFACITVAIAGELFGVLGRVQRILIKAWARVGLPVTVYQRPPSRPCGGSPAPVVTTGETSWHPEG
jgi:Zn-dependent metalloprotease